MKNSLVVFGIIFLLLTFLIPSLSNAAFVERLSKELKDDIEMDIQLGSNEDIDYIGKGLFEFNKSIVSGFQNKEHPSEQVCYVIKQDNVTVAGIMGRIIINNVLYIDSLFVDEHQRGNGYAPALMQKIENEAKSRGCYLAYLDTINPKAVRMYKKYGYETFAELENVPEPGVTAVYMKKLLG